MKLLKRIIFLLIIVVVAIAGYFIKQGYDLYAQAIAEMSLEDKIQQIRANENYATYEELPEDYINAVIAVEDKRFMKHSGIDFISITRAILIDIKEIDRKSVV